MTSVASCCQSVASASPRRTRVSCFPNISSPSSVGKSTPTTTQCGRNQVTTTNNKFIKLVPFWPLCAPTDSQAVSTQTWAPEPLQSAKRPSTTIAQTLKSSVMSEVTSTSRARVSMISSIPIAEYPGRWQREGSQCSQHSSCSRPLAKASSLDQFAWHTHQQNPERYRLGRLHHPRSDAWWQRHSLRRFCVKGRVKGPAPKVNTTQACWHCRSRKGRKCWCSRRRCRSQEQERYRPTQALWPLPSGTWMPPHTHTHIPRAELVKGEGSDERKVDALLFGVKAESKHDVD